MTETGPEDLAARTERYAHEVRAFLKKVPRTLSNIDDAKQLARASGSVAANWIEANEGLSRKDRVFRMKICRKEAKECGLWLRLLDAGVDVEENKKRLISEARELVLILSAIIRKLES